jgi:hypothetical protein
VVLDVGRWHLECEVLFYPGHIVGKHEELRGLQLGSQLPDGTTVIVFGTETVELPDDGIRNVIPPPHMEADGVGQLHPGEQLPVAVGRRSLHREFLADRRRDILEIAVRLPIAVQAMAIGKREDGRIKSEGTFSYEARNQSQRMGDRYQHSRTSPTDHLPDRCDIGVDVQPIQGIGPQPVGRVETEVELERHSQSQRQPSSSRILEELIPEAVFELNNDHAVLIRLKASRWDRDEHTGHVLWPVKPTARTCLQRAILSPILANVDTTPRILGKSAVIDMVSRHASTPSDDLRLGHQGSYNLRDGTLFCSFQSGFFSTCSVTLWHIAEVLKRTGEMPQRIDFSRAFRWFRNAQQTSDASDMYPLFFSPGAIDATRGLTWLPRVRYHGLYCWIDYRRFNLVMQRYFQPSEKAREFQSKWIARYSIDPAKTIAVIYRGTDKGTELALASPLAYVDQARTILERHPDFRILIQTDELAVRELFVDKFGSKCFFIEDMPVSRHGVVVHELDDASLQRDRGEFGVMLVAATELLSRAAFVVNHTGNLALWVCLWRGHSRGVVQFDSTGGLVDFGNIGFYLRQGRHLANRAWRRLLPQRAGRP